MTQVPLNSPLFKMAGLPESIRKRDGKLVAFDAAKIVNAMQRARAATGEFERAALDPVAERVLADIATLPAGGVPDIEHIQDSGRARAPGAPAISAPPAPTSSTASSTRRLREDSRTAGRRGSLDQRVPGAARLARQRQRQPGLFAGRPDPERVGQGGRQLLALPRLCAGGRARAPRGRHPHSRPRHARRLLRRLVAAHAAARGAERRARQGRGGAAEAPVERGRPDRQLPRHAAKRVGRRAGVQLVRHLPGALRPQGSTVLRRGAASASRS